MTMSAPTAATPRFRVVDAAMVRIASRPADGHLHTSPPPEDADPAAWQRWARHVADDVDFIAAVQLASPSLAEQIAKVVAGARLRPARYLRLGEAVLRYRSRMTRATPLGLFAGIAPARFGTDHRLPDLDMTRHTIRVGAEWLHAAVTVLEGTSELLLRASVALDNTAFVRDDRLVLPHARRATGQWVPGASTSPRQPHRDRDDLEDEPAAEVTIRYTAAVRLVHQLTATPVSTAQLLNALHDRFPDTAPTRITALVSSLVEAGFLRSDLRAPMTVTDPLGHLVDRLAAYDAHNIEPITDLVDELRAVHHLIRADFNHAAARSRTTTAAITDRMRNLTPVTRPLGIDLSFGGTLVLPEIVAREAETAAGTLTRLAPPGSPRLRAYHQAFIERYGPGAVVPLTEVIDTERGLGWPDGHHDTADHKPRPVPFREDREAALLTLAWTAARDHATEVVLDEDTLARLATDPTGSAMPPPAHLELGFRLHAADHHALSQGRFRLVVFTASRAAATMTGRFLDLLDPVDHDRMTDAYRGLPTTVADALPVQLSCPPLYATTHDIARSPAVLPDVLHLGEHPPAATAPRSVPLADLALHGGSRRLHLISLSQRRAVHPHLLNAVELTRRAHPLVRLLCDLEAGQTALPGPFPWGAARHLPFLPRVRDGRTILSPARWKLTTADLPGPEEPFIRWAAAVEVWRDRNHVPDLVLIGTGDRQLRLTLTDENHLRLLRADLHRRTTLTLAEAPTTTELAWMAGRMHEIIVPLARDTPPVPAPRLRGVAVTRRDHAHVPGHGDWLYLKLYTRPDRHHGILRDHLPNLLASWSAPPHWWFLPYRDPDDHLRLRLAPAIDTTSSTTSASEAGWQAQAMAWVGRWSADLRRRGLISRIQLDTYLPEVGRFGDGALLAAAEAVFVADSAYVLHQGNTAGVERDAAVAAGLVDLVVAFLGDPAAATRWLVDRLDHTTTPPPPRTTLRRARELATSSLDHLTTPVRQDDDLVIRRRRHALAFYADLRRSADVDTDAVLPALLHLHCVRSLGLDRDAERLAHRLARAVALGHRARIRSSS
ncbi:MULTISPECIES: lantibiotic dehydratase [Saccharothrix]|uniref:lantibiotic dehydratase n=1 Tax=Saccharothrix TaxID=2071 RepID=UPI0009FB2360|nr:lantibiotic dehydratase [Saccharothrix sp. CB00851]